MALILICGSTGWIYTRILIIIKFLQFFLLIPRPIRVYVFFVVQCLPLSPKFEHMLIWLSLLAGNGTVMKTHVF